MWNRLKNFFIEKEENCNQKESIATSFSSLVLQTRDAAIERGDRLWQQGQIAEAITFYRQALEIDSNSSEAHQKLALALQKQGNLAEAMIHYRKAIVFYHYCQSQKQLKSSSKLQLPQLNNSYVINPVYASANSVSFKLSAQQQRLENNNSNGIEETDTVGANRSASSALIEVKPTEEFNYSEGGHGYASDGRTKSYSENTMNFSFSTEAAQIYIQQALSYCDEQQWSQAIAACQKALELTPKLAQAYKIWGNALLGMGKNADAMGCYAEAITIQPDMTEVYANMGSIYARQQKWQQAIEYYQKAIAIDPEFTGAYRHLGRVWKQLGESLKAWECQERVLSLEPEKGTAREHLQLADELKQQGQLEKAVLHYRYAIKIDPNLYDAYQNLAETLEQLGQWQEAAIHYRRLIEVDLNARKGLTSPDVAARQGERGCQGFESRDADPAAARSGAGRASQARGKTKHDPSVCEDRSRNRIPAVSDPKPRQKPYRLNPSSEPKILPSGLLMTMPRLASGSQEQRLLTAGSPQEASLSLTARTSQVVPLADQTGKSKQVRIERAIAQYRQKAEQYPDSAEIQANLGSLYARQQQWQEAIFCYRKAIELNPHFTGVYRNLARVLEKIGQKAVAAQYWYRAFNFEPNSFKAEEHLQLGNILGQQGKLEQAVACYRRAIQYKPSLTEVYLRLGEILQSKGQQQEAITCYRQAVKHSPQNAQCFYHLGLTLAKLAQWDEAIDCYQRSAELQPHSWEIAHHLGDALSKQQRWQEAIEAYGRAIELKDDFAWSHNNLGDAFLHLQRWEEAARSFRRAIELNPEFPWSHYNLGEALVYLEEWDEAIAAYRRAVQLQPDLPQAEQKIEQAIHQRIKADEAKAFNFYLQAIAQEPTEIDNYLKALAIQPQNLDVYRSLSRVLLTEANLARGLGETVIEELISCYQAVIANNPRLTFGYLTLARLREIRGEWHSACQYRYRALQLEPERANASECVELGNALLEAGNRDEAAFCYRRSIELDPHFKLGYLRLGELLEEQESLSLYRQAVEQFPEDALVHFHLGRAWTKQQNWQEAIACYQTTIQLQPDYWQAYHHWGDALRQQQQWQEASVAYRQAIAIEPSFSWSYYNLAVALSNLDRWEEAFTCYQKIREIEPNFWHDQTDFQLQHQLGDALFEQQKWAEAMIVYQQTITVQPDYARAHYNLGRILLKQERLTEAIEAFRQATLIDPNFAWAYYHLGDISAKRGIWDEAIASYRQAVQLQPDLPSLQAKLADALGRRSQLDAELANHLKNEDAKNLSLVYRRYSGEKAILVIDTHLPYYDKESGARRLFQLLKIFKQLNYHVIFAADSGFREEPYLSQMQNLQIEVLDTEVDCGTSIEEQIQSRLPLLDFVWICRPELNEKYLPVVRQHSNAKVIYDAVALHYLEMKRAWKLSPQPRSIKAAREWVNMQARELKVAHEADLTVTVTPLEREILEQQAVSNLAVIPHIHDSYRGEKPSFGEREGLLFIGNYDRSSNIDAAVWLCEAIMPLIWGQIPEVKVTLLGSNPTEKVESLASDRITVTGYIEDVSSYFLNHRVFVAPLRYGAGMKGQIGQSLEYGLPIVSTDIGIEGMNLISERDVLEANTTETFVQQIVRLYRDENLWNQLAASTERVLSPYSAETIETKLAEIIRQLSN